MTYLGRPVERSATVRDVARLANLSLGTVSNFLSDKKPISDEARSRIERAIEELGFIPNSAVRVMRGARSHAIGFLIPDAGNPFFAEVARGVEEVAIVAGHVIVTCNTDGDPMVADRYATALAEMRVAGVVATAMSESEPYLKRLAASGAGIVLLGPPQDGLEWPSLGIDGAAGAKLGMQHLLDAGHRRVVFLGGPGGVHQMRDRYRGCVEACHEFGVDPDVVLHRIDAEGSSVQAREAVANVVLDLNPRPTAIFGANDLLALAVETSALRRGLRVPLDVAIVGFDDIDAAANAVVPLTTIRQPKYELGRIAARVLLGAVSPGLAADEIAARGPELIVRESSPIRR